jgi:hypothetical protein
MLRGALYILLGLVLGPFIWLFTKLGWIKPASVLPKPIQDFSNYLWGQGLHAGVSLQNVKVNHAECLAYLQFGLDPSKFRVVTLTHSSSADLAELVEKEALTAPQFTAVRRNGTLVMACTFTPPDPDLEARLVSAFTRYGGST